MADEKKTFTQPFGGDKPSVPNPVGVEAVPTTQVPPVNDEGFNVAE